MVYDQEIRRGKAAPCAATPVLMVPGLGNSGPRHWQTLWEAELLHVRRVDLGNWDEPDRDMWVRNLDAAVRAATAPVVIVAHSLGCVAVVRWAASLGRPHSVAGALLVAPADCEQNGAAPCIAAFGPMPQAPLPFPALLVASRDDPFMRFERAAQLAAGWGSELVDAGAAGHINADSRLGAWPFGRRLLGRFVGVARGGA